MDTDVELRVLADGQWLGTSNCIRKLAFVRGQWVATDSTGSLYTQDDWPDGLRTWDEPTSGMTKAPYTPWPADPVDDDAA